MGWVSELSPDESHEVIEEAFSFSERPTISQLSGLFMSWDTSRLYFTADEISDWLHRNLVGLRSTLYWSSQHKKRNRFWKLPSPLWWHNCSIKLLTQSRSIVMGASESKYLSSRVELDMTWRLSALVENAIKVMLLKVGRMTGDGGARTAITWPQVALKAFKPLSLSTALCLSLHFFSLAGR